MPWPKGKPTEHLREWTKEQEDFVRENYDGNGSKLAEVLPFSSAAIRNKAKRLGVVNHSHFHNFSETKLPELRPEELGYIAGFLDGEGSIFYNDRKQSAHQWKMNFCNTHKETIYWIHRKLGIGKIREYQPRLGQSRVVYLLDIIRQGDVLALLSMLYPYLHIKTQRAYEALYEIRNHKKLMVSGG